MTNEPTKEGTVRVDAMVRREAPWKDYAGNPICVGDRIVHPSGQRGTVIFIKLHGDAPEDQWLVDYGTGGLSRLCLQIGDKGQAVVDA